MAVTINCIDHISTNEVHKRRYRMHLAHKELARIVAEAAAASVEGDPPKIGDRAVTHKVRFEEATEGSPPYRVGTKAVVDIVIDLGALPGGEGVVP